ncbi:CehA/McbA family metallohydrolase [Sphingosinicella rhizophila]|uniref:CehA/McbA family metallohydrolase n=1 Tax=Sphingosinicella rhizophila TaxID=3050082 RepID=A0ABU3Q9T5_9SPHN|nr:CehA/McbA family metallohydrolase [Sphingosinicella sp. GR2756]MDT9599758.1 CehA/McbA family metallohydrolase [Sphingosinicella sp. GR2756]
MVLLSPAEAQWTNRYPRPDWLRHSVYYEGHELPIFSAGPIDPAPAPDGLHVAFAAQGWIWVLNLTNGVATRVTRGKAIDSRPRWSPDSRELVFVRDSGRVTSIVRLNLARGLEDPLVENGALNLDPEFSRDGQTVFYSSAEAGDLDIWRISLSSRKRTRVTSAVGVERNPRSLPGGKQLTYLSADTRLRKEIREISLSDGSERILRAKSGAGQASFDLNAAGQTLVYAWPNGSRWQIEAIDRADPVPAYEVTKGRGLPRSPAWSADGATIYFVEGDLNNRSQLYRVRAAGGTPEEVKVESWDWRAKTGRIRIVTTMEDDDTPIPVRLTIEDERGHPLVPASGPSYFDSQSGRVYFFSPGTIELEAPAGGFRVTASRGLTALSKTRVDRIPAGRDSDVRVRLSSLWNPRAAGWVSGDHHFHMTYDGIYRLTPDALLPLMAGEALDVATPLLANINNRLLDAEWAGTERVGTDGSILKFGQEVRADLLGHLGLIGIEKLYEPWFWGPPYPDYGFGDRINSEALQLTRREGGLSSYVHAIRVADPFAKDAIGQIPLELVADAVLGEVDALELLGLWSSGEGNSQLWYRLLNAGLDIVPIAGTDAFVDTHRGMALGTVRTYVQLDGAPLSWSSYQSALKSGRSFITNGPILLFQVAGKEVGEVIPHGDSRVRWRLELPSAANVERIEIIANGAVIWGTNRSLASSRKVYEGVVMLPRGGWIAAKARGGETRWPSMGTPPFAHTAPIWISHRSSFDQKARQAAVHDLLLALSAAEARSLKQLPYSTALRARLALARTRLEGMVQ